VGAISADTRAAVDLYHAIEDLPPGIRGDGPPDIPVKQGLLVVQVDVNLVANLVARPHKRWLGQG